MKQDGYLFELWDDLNNMWDKLDALQGRAYLCMEDPNKADEISEELFEIKQTIIKVRDSIPLGI